MKQYSIKLSGSGSQDQLAIRLLALGRMLQLGTNEEQFTGTFEDGCLCTEIEEE